MDQLRELFGDALLNFLLARESDAGDTELTKGQQATLAQLNEIRNRQENAEKEIERFSNVSWVLGQYLAGPNTTVAWALHLQSGGTLPAINHDDELTKSLLIVARDMWPGYLLPGPDRRHSFFHGASSFSHPEGKRAWGLYLKDKAIKKLFPDAPDKVPTDEGELVAISSNSIYSNGAGSGVQLLMLTDTLIRNAEARQSAYGDPGDLQDFLAKIVEVLEETRKLASGKEITIFTLVGLANLSLPEGASLDLPFGKLRALRESDYRLFPKEQAAGGGQLTAVLETTSPFKILSLGASGMDDDGFKKFESFYPSFEEYHARSQRDVVLARFSVLLASEADLLAPVQLARLMLGPLDHGPSMSWSYFVPRLAGTNTLDEQGLARVAKWAERIDKEHNEKLSLGVKRLLSAVGERVDPVDGFIDAVVCWENMFGSKTESMFRICAAISCLLEPTNAAKRTDMYSKLKKLYGTRSDVVHGATELNTRTASQYRDYAVRVGLDAIRKLFDYPELLAVTESAKRGQDILLALGTVGPLADENDQEPLSV